MAKTAGRRRKHRARAREPGAGSLDGGALQAAIGLYRQGRFSEAVTACREVLADEPDSADANLCLALSLKQLGALPEALHALRRVVAIDPESAVGHENLGIMLADLHQRDAALEAFRRSVEIAPERASAWGNLGNLLMVRGELEEAVSALERAVAIDPTAALAYFHLCWALRRLGRPGEAVQAGRRAVELAPRHVDAYNYLTFALLADDRCAEAVEVCDASLRVNPRNTAALAYKPSALEGLERREEGRALVDFERLIFQSTLDEANGFESLDVFNAALVDHVLSSPTRPFDDTQTTDIMLRPQGPLVELTRIVNEMLKRYVENLPLEPAHPFLSVRPRSWKLDGWGTRLQSYARHEHHFHQHGWISGVYYAKVPDAIGTPDAGLAGTLEFCRFPQYSQRRVESEFVAIPPAEGVIVFFPSYFYHRVVEFEGPATRISIAFNAVVEA